MLLSFLLLLGLLTLNLRLVAFDRSFYLREFQRTDRPSALQTSMAELDGFSRNMISYLRGRSDSPNYELQIAGENRLFLNERELEHMVDVLQLFKLAAVVGYGTLAFFVVSYAESHRRHLTDIFRLRARQAALLALGICTGATLLILVTFSDAFWLFHEIAFTNDLWLLTPGQDLLIDLVPECFFANAVALALSRTLVGLAFVSLAGWQQ